MSLTLIHDAPAVDHNFDPKGTIPAGQTVEYCNHIPGGYISVRWNGSYYTIDPRATKELA